MSITTRAAPEGKARIPKADLAPPTDLLPRLRWSFLGITLLSLVAALVVVEVGSLAGDTARLLAAAGACWLGFSWVATYRRGRSQVEEDLVSMAALTALVAGLASPLYSVGVLGMGATLRSLYSRPRGAVWVAGCFFLPYLAGVALDGGARSLSALGAAVLLGLSGVGIGVLVGQLVRSAADRHQRVLDLAQELRRAGEVLAAAINPGLIELALLRSAQSVASELATAQLVLVRLVGSAVTVSAPLRVGEEPGGGRAMSPGKLPDPALRYLLGAAGEAPPGSSASIRQFLRVDGRLDQLTLAPLGPPGESRGSLVLASAGAAPVEVVDSLRVLGAQAGLALSRA